MNRLRRRVGIALAVASVSAGLGVTSVSANHIGQTVDCGDAGTYTIHAQPNGAGFEAPPPGDVLRFEGGSLLTVFTLTIGGNVVFDGPSVGMAHNALAEVTCTFTLANGVAFEVTGLLIAR